MSSLPLPILTPRLLIKPPEVGEGPMMAEAIAETWEDLNAWEDWASNYEIETNPDTCERKGREALDQFTLRTTLPFRCFCRQTGRFVCFADLDQPNWDLRTFIAGYWTRKSEQGKGYATEATNALLRYAFNALDASKVGIGHAVGNAASEHIIKKLGFTLLTQRTKVVFLSGGRVLDDKIYARISLYGLPPLDVTWGDAARIE